MKNLIRFIFIFLAIYQTENIYAKSSMRNCLLLPVTDNMQGALAFKVFEEVENYLKDSNWCVYKTNSEILNILKNYRNNLAEHLANKEVLKILAEKTDSGTMIKINLENVSELLKVEIEVIGEDGESSYLKESAQVKNSEPEAATQAVKNWLNEFQKGIPYDGKVVGVLGDQFSADFGKQFGINTDDEVTVVRPVKRKMHPLLKEIVEWETEKIGDGKMFHVALDSSQGKITQYENRKKLQLEDWVIVKRKSSEVVVNTTTKEESPDGYNFGKIGRASVYLDLSSDTVGANNGNNSIYDGNNYGIYLLGEIWITREYWAALEFGRKFGKYSKHSGPGASETEAANSVVKIKTGYKYLPMGFFFGPQLDGYVGYGSYNYGLGTNAAGGIVAASFKGAILGIRGSVPFFNTIRPFLGLEFMLFPKYEEDANMYGNLESVTSYQMQVGSSYIYNNSTTLDGLFSYTANKTQTKSADKVYSFKEISLKLGATFSF